MWKLNIDLLTHYSSLLYIYVVFHLCVYVSLTHAPNLFSSSFFFPFLLYYYAHLFRSLCWSLSLSLCSTSFQHLLSLSLPLLFTTTHTYTQYIHTMDPPPPPPPPPPITFLLLWEFLKKNFFLQNNISKHTHTHTHLNPQPTRLLSLSLSLPSIITIRRSTPPTTLSLSYPLCTVQPNQPTSFFCSYENHVYIYIYIYCIYT